jgi:D-lactate dehydrogenase
MTTPSQRLENLKERLQRLSGLDEPVYQRLLRELDLAAAAGHPASSRTSIVMFDSRSYDRESFDRQNHADYPIHYVAGSLGPDTVASAEGRQVACLFVNDHCTEEMAAELARRGIQLIALRCAGFNNVNLEACKRFGLSVVRVPAYSPHAVAEHTVALMLMLNRHLHVAYQRNRAGSFILDGLTGFDMHGKTAGVVGTGHIGRCVAEILLGFGCRVLAFDKFPNPALASRSGLAYTTLDDLLHQSDIVTLHTPLLPETHHLINARTISQMRRGVMLINTSRGGLVDARALIVALKTGQVGYAGLDVYEEESGVFFHDMSSEVLTDDVLARLLTFNNVVITSHQAYLTSEALTNIADTTLANIAEFEQGRRGRDLTNAVPGP